MHTPPGTSLLPPTIFYRLKFENWPKIQCTSAYIVDVCRGNHTKIFSVMSPGICVKISVSNFGGPTPLKF